MWTRRVSPSSLHCLGVIGACASLSKIVALGGVGGIDAPCPASSYHSRPTAGESLLNVAVTSANFVPTSCRAARPQFTAGESVASMQRRLHTIRQRPRPQPLTQRAPLVVAAPQRCVFASILRTSSHSVLLAWWRGGEIRSYVALIKAT